MDLPIVTDSSVPPAVGITDRPLPSWIAVSPCELDSTERSKSR